ERISKKKTKNEAKTTKPDTEWKSVEKTQSSPSPSVEKSTQVAWKMVLLLKLAQLVSTLTNKLVGSGDDYGKGFQ
ncbi:hypothetical protein Tco_1271620, partial [Tanacetum coccineum]